MLTQYQVEMVCVLVSVCRLILKLNIDVLIQNMEICFNSKLILELKINLLTRNKKPEYLVKITLDDISS